MFVLFVSDYGYGHPGAFNPFLLNPGWLDAAYLNYAWADYFRAPQLRDQGLVKGNAYFFYIKLISSPRTLTISSFKIIKSGNIERKR